ncbi:MAG: hypothetical protein AB1467_00090 [Candidatus Diapherotrites archaeon]
MKKMARVKDKEKKDFFISQRKKIGSSITNAPVWAVRKRGKRIFSKKQKRTWRQIDLGKMYKKKQRKSQKKKGKR